MSPLKDLYTQLAHRGVLRIGAIYIAVAWMIIESGDILLPLFDVSDDSFRWLVITLFAGFPVALILAWVFEITDKGIVVDDAESIKRAAPGGRGVDFVVIGVLVVALGFSLFMNFQPQEGTTVVAPQDPMPILVADFTNSTGESLFAGALEQALEIGLEGAPFVTALSRTDAIAVAQTINPEFEKLEPEVARLVAAREGVKLVLSGDALADGSGFVVRVTAIEPVDGETLVEVEEFASDKIAVLEAVAKLSREIREALGDVTINPDSARETFTAASLEAIQAYLTGQELALKQDFAGAVASYAEAVELDPTFGRAWSGWALAEFELGRHKEAEELYASALKNLGNMNERERLRTTGHYYAISNQDYPKAIDTYEELTAKYPADDAAFNNLAVASFLNRDFARAVTAGQRALNIYPNSSLYLGNLALYEMYASQFEEAIEVTNKLLENQPDYAMGYLVLAQAAVAQGDFAKAQSTFEDMSATSARGRSIAELGKIELGIYRGDIEGVEGQLREAIDTDLANSNLAGAAAKELALAAVFAQQNNTETAAQLIESALGHSSSIRTQFQAGLLYEDLKLSVEASKLADQLRDRLSKEGRAYGLALEAYRAFNEEDLNSAIDLARSGIEQSDLWWLRYLLGRAYLQRELFVEAFSEFQTCLERIGEGGTMFLDDAPSWQYVRDLNYWLGRSQEALQMGADARDRYALFEQQMVDKDTGLVQDARTRVERL